MHAGGRYRLIGLTPEEARELAAMLAKAADISAAYVRAVSRAAPTVDDRPAAQCPAPRLPPPG